jgi:SSS family solute:Na+ symporter
MGTLGIVDIAVFVLFIVAVIGVGLFKSKGEDTHGEEGAADYFLAGRGLTWWLIGFSLIAANISAEQFVGMSGQAADYLGLAISSYEWMAAITLVVVAFVFLPYFLRAGIFTIPQFLEVRYNHWARLIMTIFMMLILIGVSLSGVIYAGAVTMTDIFQQNGINLSLTASCWILGLMAGAYVATGGLKAAVWADLIQGTALIIGGALIAWFAFRALGHADVASLVDANGAVAVIPDGAGTLAKFKALNADKMHMVLPKSDLNIPWTALIIGLWIPNFYYWGLNQYITQRILGSASLKEGQKGLVFAAALKLIVPFIIVIPGIIAFNLYSDKMADIAAKDPSIQLANKKVIEEYQKVKDDSQSMEVFVFDNGWAKNNAEMAPEIEAYNAKVREAAKAAGTDNKIKEMKLAGYKYDSALSMLIGNLIPQGRGLLGFIIAALLGAIISSLAAVLNASSTVFTMDIYQSYIKKDASQFQLVTIGRICVGVFMVIGCVVSPLLANPKFGGIFKYIQEFQGFVTPGILAVFVFGLINRRAKGITGVVGLPLNPALYWLIMKFYPSVAFLDRMAICFFVVLAAMTVIGLVFRHEEPVKFESNTGMDLTTSKGALGWGLLVCAATLALYFIFW